MAHESFCILLLYLLSTKDTDFLPLNIYTLHRVSKNCAKLFFKELGQIFTNFDNFGQKDGKEAPIMHGALIFHVT